MTPSEPIVAIATPPGTGGVALIRISGHRALPLALQCLSAKHLQPRHATLTHIIADGTLLDQAVATFYPAPHSYTGEDTLEISCHGSPYVQQAALETLIAHGARLAEPGEFTRRAFLNGKLDLSQAEAVADLIHAATPAQHRLAISQLRGGYAQKLAQLREQLLETTALLELELDFSQEDLQFADRPQLRLLLADLQQTVRQLADSFRTGQALKRGIPVAIVGRPNAGKSSLLNALLQDNRAIVSPHPGTTRDTIEETLTIDGITFRLIDTAGLRESDDPVENIGIERAYTAARQAHIVLFLHDSQTPTLQAEADIQSLCQRPLPEHTHLIVAHTKTDLAQPDRQLGILISSTAGTGIDQLKQALAAHVAHHPAAAAETLVSNARHHSALLLVLNALDHALQGLREGIPTDLLAVDLRDALYHLGTITGEVTSDEILGNIFSRFCIGK